MWRETSRLAHNARNHQILVTLSFVRVFAKNFAFRPSLLAAAKIFRLSFSLRSKFFKYIRRNTSEKNTQGLEDPFSFEMQQRIDSVSIHHYELGEIKARNETKQGWLLSKLATVLHCTARRVSFALALSQCAKRSVSRGAPRQPILSSS